MQVSNYIYTICHDETTLYIPVKPYLKGYRMDINVIQCSSQAGPAPSHYEEGSGERRIPQLCTWNVAVDRCYITKYWNVQLSYMGGTRMGHILYQQRWITVLPVGVCSTTCMTNRAYKDVQPMLLVCVHVGVLLLSPLKTVTYRTQ